MCGNKQQKDLPNEQRDAKIYELSLDKKKTWTEIAEIVNDKFTDQYVESDAAREAAKRYCHRHNLPAPPERSAGRKSKKRVY